MTDRSPAALGLRRRFVFLCAARRRAALTRLYPHSGTPGCPSISSRHPHLKLVGVPRSLAATRAALPSMSLFPKAQFDLSIHVVQFPSVQWGSRPTALPQTLVRNWSSFFSDVPDSNVKEFCNDFSFGPVIRFRAFIVMAISNRLKSVKAWLGVLCLGSALFSSACANDESSLDNSSQHHRHHGGGGGGGRYGHGQGGMFDQSNRSGSQFPVPGQ